MKGGGGRVPICTITNKDKNPCVIPHQKIYLNAKRETGRVSEGI